MSQPSPLAICLVIPAYDHAEQLRELLAGALPHVRDIIVVNNGSTDNTAEVLRDFPAVRVITFPRNRGKGRALAAGMESAIEHGFTHAITMDTNGHLLADDLPAFLERIRAQPDAVILGVRDLPRGGIQSRGPRLVRSLANAWVWMQTARWFHDTCSGFRAYPLAPLSLLVLRRVHYEFEIESLVKCVWVGMPVEQLPVRAILGRMRPSHFHPLLDTWRLLRFVTGLLWQRILLPTKVRSMMHLKVFGTLPRKRRVLTYIRGFILQETESPREIGLALGIGICLGILPIWGFQMVAAYFVARVTKLSKPLMVTATGLSFGPVLPLIIYLSLLIGNLLVDGKFDLALDLHKLREGSIWDYLVEYLVGATVLALVCGFAAGLMGYRMAVAYLPAKEEARND